MIWIYLVGYLMAGVATALDVQSTQTDDGDVVIFAFTVVFWPALWMLYFIHAARRRAR